MSESTITAKCAHCGAEIGPHHGGPCPKCGQEGKKIAAVHLDAVATAEATLVVSPKPSVYQAVSNVATSPFQRQAILELEEVFKSLRDAEITV
jgi:hypothetical protein